MADRRRREARRRASVATVTPSLRHAMRRRPEVQRGPAQSSGAGAHGAEQLGIARRRRCEPRKFGEGVIVDIEGSGDKAEASCASADVGEKRLLLVWAPLTRLSA